MHPFCGTRAHTGRWNEPSREWGRLDRTVSPLNYRKSVSGVPRRGRKASWNICCFHASPLRRRSNNQLRNTDPHHGTPRQSLPFLDHLVVPVAEKASSTFFVVPHSQFITMFRPYPISQPVCERRGREADTPLTLKRGCGC